LVALYDGLVLGISIPARGGVAADIIMAGIEHALAAWDSHRSGLSASGVSTRRDGVIDNIRTGRDQNQVGNQAMRAQLLFKPSEMFQIKLSADFTNFRSNCCMQVYYRVATRDVARTATRHFARPAGLAA
jgi:hypothetical protein